MKRARLYGLVLLALFACLLIPSQASALDHPWDDNKHVDTTYHSATGNWGTKSDNSGDNTGGSFWDWLIQLFNPEQDVKKEETESRFKEFKSRKEYRKSYGYLNRPKI